jgi:hypothetical protein
MSLIVLPPDDDHGEWRAEARLHVEVDGTVALILVREWRSDGVEPDDLRSDGKPRALSSLE